MPRSRMVEADLATLPSEELAEVVGAYTTRLRHWPPQEWVQVGWGAGVEWCDVRTWV
jgi:hypothetical protein